MFWAKNKNTGKDTNSVNEYSEDFMKDETWYALPTDIEICPENIDINKIEVKYRNRSKDMISESGNIYFRHEHFFIPNAEKLGIKPKKISKHHIKCQHFIAQYIKENNLKYFFKDEEYTFEYNLDTLRYETVKESTYKTIRADILIKFKEKNERFGRGIIFEIQLSNQRDKTYKDRTEDRALTDYSVVWINKEDFVDFKSDLIELNKQKFIIFPVLDVLKSIKNNIFSEIKELTINYSNMLTERIKQEVKDQIVLKCPKCGDYLINKSGRFGDFKGCNSYPKCNYIFRGEK